MSRTADIYSVAADIYPTVAAPQTEAMGAALAELLAGPRPGPLGGAPEAAADSPVLDLGSGTGGALPYLARLGSGPLYAVEPSAAMRAGLMATVCAVPGLAERTTVLGGALDDVEPLLPDRLGAVTALNMLGHLDEAAEDRFWGLVRERLVPGGAVVIALHVPLEPAPVPWTDFGTTAVGDLRYRTEGRADPEGGAMAWTMRWTISTADGAVLETRTAHLSWRVLTPDHLRERAAGALCEPGPARDDLLLHSFRRL